MATEMLGSDTVDRLINELASFTKDPYGFVLWAFPWGEPNTSLADLAGPDPWQTKFLKDLGKRLVNPTKAIQMAIASGKGIGKSTLMAWLTLWAFSTAPETRGRVTANTKTQLETTTWTEVGKWFNYFIARELFELGATTLCAKEKRYKETWAVDAMPWSKDNPDAFRGMHNFGKRLFIGTDEASGIDDIIWEALDGCTTDANTEIIWIAISNPSRNYGRFRECFAGGKHAKAWQTRHIDARGVTFTNKEKIAEWQESWGADSDYFKVNVCGEFPSVSSLQLIPTDVVQRARICSVSSYPHDPLIFALDVARFGDNKSVLARRRGRDMRTMPRISWRGLSVVDLSARVGALIAEHSPDAVFIDEGGIGGGVVDVLRSLGHAIIGVNFGGKPGSMPKGTKVANKRAEMYVELRDWLVSGGAIEDDDELEEQIVQTEFGFNRDDAILLESKEDMRKRGIPSPDDTDAYVLTFAFPVAKRLPFARSIKECTMEYDVTGVVQTSVPRFTRYAEMMEHP